jgi:hypothetical protein
VNISFTAPTSWKELSQEQLLTVFDLMAIEQEPTAVKTYMLIYFCGLHVIKHTRFGWKFWTMVDGRKRVIYLTTSEIQGFTRQFDFIDQVEDMDCRLDAVCGLHAADPLLQQGVNFNEYLHAEKYYQIFVETQNMEYIDNLAQWLYHDSHGRAAGYGDAVDNNGRPVEDVTLTPGERVGTLLWFVHVKRVMARAFPHFFKRTVVEDGQPEHVDFMELYNIQLRALTGGDVTKESTVLSLECWRALTELDAKAREAEELEKIRNKH